MPIERSPEILEIPDIPDLLMYPESVIEGIEEQVEEVYQMFRAGELYPGLDELQHLFYKLHKIVSNAAATRMALKHSSNHEEVIMLSKLEQLYDRGELYFIAHKPDHVADLIDFSEYLHHACVSLLREGNKLASTITKGMSLRAYGNTTAKSGLLILRYRDIFSYRRTKLYSYILKATAETKARAYILDFKDDCLIQASETFNTSPLFTPMMNRNQIISITSTEPADLKGAVEIIARHLLLKELSDNLLMQT